MIRPSALTLAQHCGLAARLAEEFPETSAAAERGAAIHEEIADALQGGTRTTSAEAAAAIALVKDIEGDTFVEHKVALRDPETNEVITEGTLDWGNVYEVGQRQRGVKVRDWKTGQMVNVAQPDDNLQLLAYGLALALEADAVEFQVVLSFLDGDQVTEIESRVYASADWWPLLDRVKAAASKEPVAKPGPHCGGCYQKHHCPAWRDRAVTALSTILGSTDLALNDDTASELAVRLDVVDKASEIAREALKGYIRSGGKAEAGGKVYKAIPTAGRKSGPSVAELEAQGLGHLVKVGKPGERWGWVRP